MTLAQISSAHAAEAKNLVLDGFLASRGLTRETLLDQAGDDTYGTPLLLVACGSILHGVGNQRSDLDLNIVVERPVIRLPIATFADRLLLDTTYFTASQVESWPATLRARPWPPVGPLSHDAWRGQLDTLFHVVRFAEGVVLRAQDGWEDWAAAFRAPWVAAVVAQWWHVEAIRRRVAAQWLARAKPTLAAQRALDAVLAAMESRAAAGARPFYGPKWISEKLRALDDGEGLDILRRFGRVPRTPDDALAYVARCEALLDEQGHCVDPSLAAQLWVRSGVTTHAMDRRTLVSRWKLRGVELAGTVPPLDDPSRPFWQGPLGAPPPPGIQALFVEDMTWLSIVSAS